MATNWRRKWALGGWTPYYYFYPDQVPLRTSEYTTLMGLISIFLWVLFFVSFILWWMVDWMWLYVAWIVLLVGIFVEWGVGYGISYTFETEAKEDAMNKDKGTSSEDTTPMKIKSTVQLKSLKMQL